MNAEQARRANDVLEALLAAPPAERDALLRARCAGDVELESLVRRLAAHAVDDTATASPAALREAFSSLFAEGRPREGGQVGAYRLCRRLGSGGAADVYLAERDVDGQPQTVTIKFLRGGESAHSPARFRQEQQILAQLSHPGIAKLLDFGQTLDGVPYFVMEYVDGQPIDQWCDAQGLDLQARLRLMVAVADAVQHAHRALVVHRDLKPSNVLVDSRGQPRVLDFGIAKLLDAGATDALTEPGGAPATLGFASPEQLRGEPAAVTSDVYQLGVLLYLLVVGVRPQATRSLSREEALRLAGSRPLAPSERLRRLLVTQASEADAIARQRRLRAKTLLRRLSGDVDQIVLKAMAVHPDDRYQSAAALAEDLQLLLEGRPLSTRRGQWRYVLGKLLRRHPLPFALAGALLLSLLVFAVVVTQIALDLDRARRVALQQGALSDRVLDHVVVSLRELEPSLSGFEGSIVRQALDRAASAPPAQFGEDALTQIHLRLTLGRGYETVWAIDEATAQYALADGLLDALPAEQRPAIEARVRNGQGRMLRMNGDLQGAQSRYRQVLALAAAHPQLGLEAARAKVGLSVLADAEDRRDEALALMREALLDHERLFGPEHPDALSVGYRLALTLLGNEEQSSPAELEEAEQLLGRLLPRYLAALGESAPATLSARLLYGRTACYAGRPEDCVARIEPVLELARRVLGEQNLSLLRARSEFGVALLRSQRRDVGWAELNAAVDEFESRWNRSGRHGSRHGFGLNLASAHWLEQDQPGALAALRRFRVDREIVASHPELSTLAALLADDPAPR